jgi:hypothetical protein
VWRTTLLVFFLGALVIGSTVAGPGLAWDEPAYRHSQVTLQWWLHELRRVRTFSELGELFSRDAIHRYWEFNRFGHNFHPPMGSYLNLATYALFGGMMDDISARRMASVLELAAAAALLAHYLGRRYGWPVGLFSAATFLTMPRLVGDAHIIGTDMPMLFFWSATTLAFLPSLNSRKWQAMFAFFWTCLFLVKFTAMVLLVPIVAWFLAVALRSHPAQVLCRWLGWMSLIAIGLIPLVLTILFGGAPATAGGRLVTVARLGMEHSIFVSGLFLWPAVVRVVYRLRTPQNARLPVMLDLPWTTLLWTPLICIALNPTWWHNPAASLAQYFALNLYRQESLPEIGIFYLGQRYMYSLPWHNAYVLMAVTIPAAALVLGLVGLVAALSRVGRDWVPFYFAVHAFVLPIFRMWPTPAHDGVRLFLPTFFYWAGLAGIAAGMIAARFGTTTGRWRAAWIVLATAGPCWAAVEWARIHPYELSYYNIGLRRAVDWGFEATYWYDAVTPRVLNDLNQRYPLPPRVTIGFPDPLINPEVFDALQTLGRLRSDINADAESFNGFPWMWLLSHSSKATAFTKLLFACKPWYASGVEGVRLFSVVDDRAVARAWALHTLAVQSDQSRRLGPVLLNESVFSADAASIRASLQPMAEGIDPARDASRVVHRIVADWRQADHFRANLERVQRHAPESIDWAINVLVSRPNDIRRLLLAPGYQLPERFGGYFDD